MKDFKSTHKMRDGDHPLFCGGGKVMRKARGGTVMPDNSVIPESKSAKKKLVNPSTKKYSDNDLKNIAVLARNMVQKKLAGGAPAGTPMNAPVMPSPPPTSPMGQPAMKKGGSVGCYSIGGMPGGRKKGGQMDNERLERDNDYAEEMREKKMKKPATMCWGGKAMKKAKGGYAEGGMRSESTEAAKAHRNDQNAYSDEFDAKMKHAQAQGYKAQRITLADLQDARSRAKQATDEANEISEQTAHPFAGYSKKSGDEDLAKFRRDYDSDYGLQKKRGGMAKGGNWIAGAIKHKGALHRALGVPEGEKIPASKIEKATHSSNPKLAKRARLAQTLKSFHKG